MLYDAIIVGGGPTGLSAALILGRCRRRTIVIDSGKPRNAASAAVSGFLSRDGMSPFDLRRVACEQLKTYPCVEMEAGEAVDACSIESGFEVVLSDGRSFRGRRLLLATGLEDQLPPVEGMERFWGHSVFVCPVCDAWEIRDRKFLVYGAGPEMPAFSVDLLLWSRDMIVATPGECGFPGRDRRFFERHGIRLIESPLVRFEGEGRTLKRVVFADGEVVERDAVFLLTTQCQRSALPRKLGCRFTDEGAVDDRELERTNIPGLYVAGNASKGLQLAIVAAAEGAKAAFSINESLQAEDTGFWAPEDLE